MGITAAFMVPHPPLIIPQVGGGQEQQIRHTTDNYHEIARGIGQLQPETIVLISPHQMMYTDYFHISPGRKARGDFGRFRAGQVKLEASYDTGFVKKLCSAADKRNLSAGTLGEKDPSLDHGSMVPLYFVNQYWTDYQLVRIGLSGLPLTAHYELGEAIRETAEALNRKTIVIASGDLSHRLKEDGPYGYQKEGPEYDSRIMSVMEKADFGALLEFSEDFCEKAGECGHRSFTVMAGALDGTQVEARRHSYEGPFGVGYGICSYRASASDPRRHFRVQYEEMERARISENRKKEDAYVRLARKTIENYIRTGSIISLPEKLPKEMYAHRAGVFVSIKKEGRLRGCIGTLQASQPSIAEEILHNAISAAVNDPRFSPIDPEELDRLTISVDVLGEMEKIESQSQLDVKRYGVVVTSAHKRGLLLPNLEGVDTAADQIAIAKRKAGIGEEEEFHLERFEVVRHF